jgi:hypothetical protein
MVISEIQILMKTLATPYGCMLLCAPPPPVLSLVPPMV